MCIKNDSASDMPYGLGYHITFRYPMTANERWKLNVTVGEEWELDDRKLPTGRKLKSEVVSALSENELFSNDYPISLHALNKPTGKEQDTFSGAVFESESKNIRVIYEVGNGFGHWMIFNGGGTKDFICIEPQTWMINAPNVKLDSEITGYDLIPPGGMRNDMTRIYSLK